MHTADNVYPSPHQLHIYFQFTLQEGGFICIVPLNHYSHFNCTIKL